MWPFSRDPYVRAKEPGVVKIVRTGVVVVDAREYGGLRATLVHPGQWVNKNQPIGKKP